MMMKAGRLYGPEDLRIVSVPVPEIADDEILIRVRAAALCGSDLRMIQQGASGFDEDHPLTLGHEFAGDVEKVGQAADCELKPGDRVSVAPNFGCGTCDFCVSGQGHLCADYQAFGINIDGAFAEYVKVPARAVRQGNVAVLDDGVSYGAAAINEPFSCVQNGFERNQVRPGDAVLVIGAGAIGLMHARLARMAGAGTVVVNDLSAERLQAVRDIDSGIITVDGSQDLRDFTKAITKGRGFDVIVTAAPVPAIQQISLELAAVNGRVCFFGGLPRDRQEVTLNTNLIHYRQLIVSGTTRASLAQYRRTLGYLSTGVMDLDALITARGPLEKLPEFVRQARQAQGIKYVIEF